MTLRAYRPNEPMNTNGGNDQNDWQDTLLDRPMTNRQSSLHVAYGSEPKSKVWLLTGIFAVAAILVTGYFVMQGRSGGDSIPLITADTTPYKSAPDTPGGTEIPFQDKLVFNRLDPNGKPVQAEKLLPPPEEPMPAPTSAATTTVTRTVTAPPAAVTAPTPTTTPTAAPVENVAAAPVASPTPATATSATVTTTKTAINPKTGATATTTTVASAPVAAAPAVETEATPTAELAPTPVETPVAAAPIAKPTPAATTTAPSTAAGGNVRIQLASIPDQTNAQKALPTLSSKYGSALGGAKLSLVKAEIAGKGTYWRVQSQPMDKASADSICSAVKAQGGVCITAK